MHSRIGETTQTLRGSHTERKSNCGPHSEKNLNFVLPMFEER